MKMIKNGFYLIKNEHFFKMQDPSFPFQKNGRPAYYCIEDKNKQYDFLNEGIKNFE